MRPMHPVNKHLLIFIFGAVVGVLPFFILRFTLGPPRTREVCPQAVTERHEHEMTECHRQIIDQVQVCDARIEMTCNERVEACRANQQHVLGLTEHDFRECVDTLHLHGWEMEDGTVIGDQDGDDN